MPKYQIETSGGKYVVETGQPTNGDTNPIAAAALGAGSSIPMEKQIGGGIGAAGEKLMGSQEDFSTIYQRLRDKIGAANEKAWQTSPISYGVGKAAGIAGQALIPGVGEALATVPGSAAYGATSALGESKANLVNPGQGDIEQALKDTLTGATVGAAGGAAAKGLGALAGKMAEPAVEKGYEMAPGVAGIEKGTLSKMAQSLGEKEPMKAAQTVGRTMEAQGLLQMTPETRFAQVLKAKDFAGKSVARDWADVEATGFKGVNSEIALDPLIKKTAELSANPFTRPVTRTYQQAVSFLSKTAEDNGGLLTPEHIRAALDKVGDGMETAAADSDKYKGLSKLYGTLADIRDSMVDQAAAQVKDPALAQRLKMSNQNYSFLSRLFPDMKKEALGEAVGESGMAASMSSRMGMMGGLAALARGNPGLAAAFLAGGRILPSMMEKMQPLMAKGLIQLGPNLEKYTNVLSQAANRGTQQLMLTHNMLMNNDSAYRSAMEASQ